MFTGELNAVATAVERLGARPAWSLSDADLLDGCPAVFGLQHRLAGLVLALLGELDARGLAREVGATSSTCGCR